MGPLLTIGGLIALWAVLGLPNPGALAGPWVLLVVIAVGAWWALLKLFPEKRCYICKGKGHVGIGFMLRTCFKCGGSGRVNRIGAGG